jgi:glucosyl-dolichyl phosphate glucuronosyltransferase
MLKMLPELSVIISTYNRSKYLRQTIESLYNQTYSKEKWELIIVDNNSSDDTQELVESNKKKFNNLSYYFEKNQGLSISRNKGALLAKSEYIMFLDDDAAPFSDWVENIIKHIRNTYSIAAFGGPIYPNWEGPQPSWVPLKLLQFYTYLYYGKESLELNSLGKYTLLGANLGFEKKMFFEFNGFLTTLGRVGNNLISGEETHLLNNIFKIGRPILYMADCGVNHIVLPERRNIFFLLKRLYYDGISQVLIDLENSSLSQKYLLRRLVFEISCLIKEIFSLLKSFLSPISEMVFYTCLVLRRIGRINQIIKQSFFKLSNRVYNIFKLKTNFIQI